MHDAESKMNKSKEVLFPVLGDQRGKLVVSESDYDIPFAVKRVFWIYDTDEGVVRGCHANKKSEFVLFCIAGTCRIRVTDQDGSEVDYYLDKPNLGLYLPAMVWKEMYDFSAGAVLLVLSSEKYDVHEYINEKKDWEKAVML